MLKTPACPGFFISGKRYGILFKDHPCRGTGNDALENVACYKALDGKWAKGQ